VAALIAGGYRRIFLKESAQPLTSSDRARQD